MNTAKYMGLTPSILLLICLAGFPQLSETLYSPALPNIAHSLQTSNALVQWTLSVYFIGFALGVLFWGRLSDHIGRRPTIILGIIIYAVATLSCLLAFDIQWLLLSRVFQAFGASVGSVITMTIMREAFPESTQVKLFATTAFATGLAPAIGPFLGGYINQFFGWRANFTFLLITAVILFAYVWLRLPETRIKDPKKKTAVFTTVATELIKNKHIWGSMWLVAAMNGLYFSFFAEAPFVFIKIIGLTPGQYGWMGLFLAIPMMIGGYIARGISHTFSAKKIMLMGSIIAVISSIILLGLALSGIISQLTKPMAVIAIMLPMAGIVFGSYGLTLPAALGKALKDFKAVLGTAGAIFGFSYYVCISGLTWIMGFIHNGTVLPMPLYFAVLTFSILLAVLLLVDKK